MGNALEALLKQLRNNGANTPVGAGPNLQNKKNELSSPLITGQGKNQQQNTVGNGGVNQMITQILKS